jgi:HJR/Mrr/RecB family endonuclease
MVKREHNTEQGTIDCHYFTKGKGFWCVITQVVDDYATDNVLYEGEGDTHEEAKQNALLE